MFKKTTRIKEFKYGEFYIEKSLLHKKIIVQLGYFLYDLEVQREIGEVTVMALNSFLKVRGYYVNPLIKRTICVFEARDETGIKLMEEFLSNL